MVNILSEKVNANEGAKLEKIQSGNVSNNLIQRINDKYNLYRAFLQALIEEISKHPGDYFSEKSSLKEEVKMKTTSKSTSKKTVFVVHGRNEKLRKSMFSFLRAIGLKPVEWSQAIRETGKASPYLGEVLSIAFTKAQAILVLLSGDDEAKLMAGLLQEKDKPFEKELTPQPRPNVIFEAGMAIGRDESRTILVQVGEIRPISDIAGRHITNLDNTPQKRQELMTKLKSAGCKVNTIGEDWLSEGDFTIPKSSNNQGDDQNVIHVYVPPG